MSSYLGHSDHFLKASFCSALPPDKTWIFHILCSRSLHLVFEWLHLFYRWLAIASAFLSRITEQPPFQCPTSQFIGNKLHSLMKLHIVGVISPILSFSLSIFVLLLFLQCVCLIKGLRRHPTSISELSFVGKRQRLLPAAQLELGWQIKSSTHWLRLICGF